MATRTNLNCRKCLRTSARGYYAVFLTGCMLFLPTLSPASEWLPLAHDGIHDPDNPALDVLQEPAEALSQLPLDDANIGNKVRWVKALSDGYIEPRTNVFPETKIEILDLDILMKNTGSAAYVLFPHDKHTAWLDCSNCHDKIFASKAGETPMTMLMILSGEYCGRCHGAVAFPLTACKRCHSVSQVDTQNSLSQ